jgi:hypothetical protein
MTEKSSLLGLTFLIAKFALIQQIPNKIQLIIKLKNYKFSRNNNSQRVIQAKTLAQLVFIRNLISKQKI